MTEIAGCKYWNVKDGVYIGTNMSNEQETPEKEIEMSMPDVGELVTTIELRDYFAAKAMQALITNNRALQIAIRSHSDIPQKDGVAEEAYFFAEAMLKVRNKTTISKG